MVSIWSFNHFVRNMEIMVKILWYSHCKIFNICLTISQRYALIFSVFMYLQARERRFF